MNGRILVVDDDLEMRRLLLLDLERRGYHIQAVATAEEAIECADREDFDVVLTDVVLPGIDGLELCEWITSHRPDVAVVVMTAFGDMKTAVHALRANAWDFVSKPVDMDHVDHSLRRAVERRGLLERVRLLSHPVDAEEEFEELRGTSPGMQRVRTQILRIAGTEVSVLIQGESGTGKEVAAREICRHSARAQRPFVPVNCAAVPTALFESELFGHARGAFTDARAARKGLFSEADRGTLFLDEVGEIPIEMQPKLLRALEERKIRPVGSDREVAVDVRILAATNRDLLQAIADGTFREDLYYRLNVVTLQLPSLRERGPEVLELAQHFLEVFAARYHKPVVALSEQVARLLLDYPWPGNVRELRNAIESAVVMARLDQLVTEDLPDAIRRFRSIGEESDSAPITELVSLEEIERRHVMRVLRALGDRKSRAAEVLGLDRKTLYRKLQRYADQAGKEGPSAAPGDERR